MTYDIVEKIGNKFSSVLAYNTEDIPCERSVVIDAVEYPDIDWFMNNNLIRLSDLIWTDDDGTDITLSIQGISDQFLSYVVLPNGDNVYFYSVLFKTEEDSFWKTFVWIEHEGEVVSAESQFWESRVYKFEVSKKDFDQAYRQYQHTHSGKFCYWFCTFIHDTWLGRTPFVSDSFEVCSEFFKAAPHCFDSEPSHFSSYVTSHMKNEYVGGVPDPRLALLDQIPDDHVFTFNMYCNQWR